ncbi:Gfo/Idh/MocA family oxidoreductase [Vibrio sp. T187]|uniref:Gfo/Idh/MocA family protein n=1 Tax=Vibrio TaxID=662 RepID=UPI0010CA02FA|nr:MULTISPECIES: Gfo/Idh/MocA family oxidoreductase [Vibrio]MBW3695160.1 Gfo/Idh/MocA family oxidoreductase [Vibrio sp. T187]
MRIGIIGLGDIACKAYLPIITQLPEVEPIFCTRNYELLKQLADTHRVAEYCQDYRELPSKHVDAVMIHAATSAHFKVASHFLTRGIPTFVDKPLADTAAECEKLYELASKHNTPLYVGFNRRHIPLYNQHLTGVQTGERTDLRSLRWEKNRHDLPGDLRTFIFDDFIHPLDSVNLYAKADIKDAYITHQMAGSQLARVDIQWQHNDTLLHASMNRQFGITSETVSASFVNEAYEFGSFVEGNGWKNNQHTKLTLKDWTPMLASKGFEAMLDDWVSVVSKGAISDKVVERNLASHQLAEALFERIKQQVQP